MAGQVGDLRLLLGLGEDGVGLVNDLPMEATLPCKPGTGTPPVSAGYSST